jgi:hypothetical protein
VQATHGVQSVSSVEGGSSGYIKRVSANGGPVTTLASGQNLPQYLAIDTTSVYWTNSGAGTVMRLTPR